MQADAAKESKIRKAKNTSNKRKIIKKLRQKPVYYIKVSKENTLT